MKPIKLALVFALLPAVALAETNPIEQITVSTILGDDNTPINPVRLPQSARISSQTMTAEDVEKLQARDVYDLLNYGTGIFTVTSGKKSPASINIRGDSNFAFIIDGAYIPPQLSSRILQSIPATAIEEVRIVRTSTALTINPLVGIAAPSGAANNGFIVVRTRTPKESGALAQIYGGSFGTYGGNGVAGATFDLSSADGYVQALGAYHRTDGPQGFNLNKRYDTVGLKAGIDTGSVALDVSFIKNWAGYGIVRGNSRLRPTTQDDIWRLDPIDSLVVASNGTIRWNENNTTLATLAYTKSEGSFVTEDQGLNNRLERANNNSFLNAALRHNLFLGATKFQAGVDFIHWKNPSGQYYYEGIAREEKVWGYFLQADQSLFEDRINIDLGGRIDQVEVVQGIDYFSPGRQPNANVRKIVNETLPAAHFLSSGASLKVIDGWLLNARYAWSDQAPRSGVVLADPTTPLKGEVRKKIELGVEGDIVGWLQPSLNFFVIKTKNEVSPLSYTVVSGEQVGLYGNTDGKRTGFEFVVVGRWGGDGGSGGYRASVTHYFNVLDPSGLLARTQPKTVGEITLDQEFGAWRVAGSAKYVARYESNAFTACTAPNLNCTGGAVSPYLPLGNFVNVDVNLSRQFNIGATPLRLTASVKNVLDDNYETSIGYPSIGRQFGLELTAAF